MLVELVKLGTAASDVSATPTGFEMGLLDPLHAHSRRVSCAPSVLGGAGGAIRVDGRSARQADLPPLPERRFGKPVGGSVGSRHSSERRPNDCASRLERSRKRTALEPLPPLCEVGLFELRGTGILSLCGTRDGRLGQVAPRPCQGREARSLGLRRSMAGDPQAGSPRAPNVPGMRQGPKRRGRPSHPDSPRRGARPRESSGSLLSMSQDEDRERFEASDPGVDAADAREQDG